jgi:hypothetical protein
MPWWAWLFAFPAAVVLWILTAVLVALASGPPWRRWRRERLTRGWDKPPPPLTLADWDRAYGDESEPTGCPSCGGPTEWDRCIPPNPYLCDVCDPTKRPPTLTWDEYRADPEGALRMAERGPVTVVGDERFSTMQLSVCVVDESEEGNE